MCWTFTYHAALAQDIDVLFQLQLRKLDLVQLCSVWQTDTRPVPTDKSLGPSWGPTQEELHDTATHAVSGSWDDCEPSQSWWTRSGGSDSDGDSDGAPFDDLDFDSDLLDAVEFTDSLDTHHHVL